MLRGMPVAADIFDQDTFIEKTIPPTDAPSGSPSALPVDPSAAHLEELSFEKRYQVMGKLGQGGMGEVVLASDKRIGRHVALKLVRPMQSKDSSMRDRFVREALIQGQLEHPAIAPVYDLGTAADGQVYFTMKRIRGITLAMVLSYLKRGDEDAVKHFSQSKLLTILVDVCLAIEFAHQKGVVHRDLKPANIMIGGFGEVYVIDWGLSALTATHGRAAGGTPGYMAPEQSDPSTPTDPRNDIYTLGVILFEMLTLERFNAEAQSSVENRPSARAPSRSIAPELDEICVRATSVVPGARFASARELADALQRFLDGDRDLELRRRLASLHLVRAETLVTRALERHKDTEEADRAAAMHELGSALALDPGNPRAAELIARVLLEPPTELPSEAREELEEERQHQRRVAAKGAPWAGVGLIALGPIIYVMGVNDAVPLFVVLGALLLSVIFTMIDLRRPKMDDFGRNRMFVTIFIALVATTRLFGPLFLTPALAASAVVPFMLNSAPKERPYFFGLAAFAFLGPYALERFGLLAKSYELRDGAMCILPNSISFGGLGGDTLLIAFAIVNMAIGSAIVIKLHTALRSAEESVRLYSWHLRHLAPRQVPRSVSVKN
jgi:eukaryotic-like serine/threonine-protein kinase